MTTAINHEGHKTRTLSSRIVPLVLVIVAVCSIPHLRLNDTVTRPRDGHEPAMGDNIPQGWRNIQMGEAVSFSLPPGLESADTGASGTYSMFRREGIEVYLNYTYIGASPTCINHKEEGLSRAKVLQTKVAGRDATLLHLERAAFGPVELAGPEILKGLTICVPDVGDGEHEFAIATRYKSVEDHQLIQQLVNTIKFHH